MFLVLCSAVTHLTEITFHAAPQHCLTLFFLSFFCINVVLICLYLFSCSLLIELSLVIPILPELGGCNEISKFYTAVVAHHKCILHGQKRTTRTVQADLLGEEYGDVQDQIKFFIFYLKYQPVYRKKQKKTVSI